jgi:diguanylate cyclase (GGDEF)-like protein
MLSALRRPNSATLRRRVIAESVLSVLVLCALALTLSAFDAFEHLHTFTRTHEGYELDEIFTAFLVLPLILLVFTARRLGDLKQEVIRRRSAEKKMRQLARMDPLTGLPNRRHFFEKIEARLKRAKADGNSFALFHVDLDRFKQINDTLGHAAGDYIVRYTAELLKQSILPGGLLARADGDEFLILLDFETENDFRETADRLISVLDHSTPYNGLECAIGASIGIAIFDPDGSPNTGTPELLMNADIALYRAKERGRNRYEVFRAEYRIAFEARKTLSDEILRAIERQEFFPVFQPLVNAGTLEIVGVEALARWRHPVRGVLPPSDFLEFAQSLGILVKIDEIIFREALRYQAKWRRELNWSPRISVNISADRLKSPDFLEAVRTADVSAGNMIFEISEAVIFEELDDVSRHNLNAITEMGIEIEIDDFGSGRASILSLLEMHPRRLKIDRNLITPVVRSGQARQLIRCIIDMAHSLDIEVVAEGVETLEHAAILAKQGCALLQGYAFGRPMPAPDIEHLVLVGTGTVLREPA